MTSPPDDPLWQSLNACAIGPPGGEQLFAARLARENGWDAAYAARVIEEYRRFCWLAVRTGHVVTPSEDVDQAWHLHMIHSHDYWERFCPEVLGMPFHHGPTRGGPAEADRHFEKYALTLRSYEAHFGLPPADIWPDAARRFRRELSARRVHCDEVFVVRRRTAYRWMLAGAILLALVCGAVRVLGG